MSETIIERVVIRAFQDKYTGEHYPVESCYKSNDPERIAFLQDEGFLSSEVIEVDQSEDDENILDESNTVDAPDNNSASNQSDGDKPDDNKHDNNQADGDKIEDNELLKHVGGGYYELPNGEKVQGKDKALDRLKELEADG